MEDNLEDYFDLLLNQLEYELSHLPESNNFITSLSCSPNKNITTTTSSSSSRTTTTTTVTNNENFNSNNGNLIDNDSIIIDDDNEVNCNSQDSLINTYQSFDNIFTSQYQTENHLNNNHHHFVNNNNNSITSTIENNDDNQIGDDEADHMNYSESTINDTISDQQFKGDKLTPTTIITTNNIIIPSSLTTDTITTTTTTTTSTLASNSYSSVSHLTKFNQQRESSLSLKNYNRSSFYENNDEISYNLLTASQIQRIIDHYKLLVNDHHEEPMEVKWDRKGKKTNGSNGGTDNLTNSNLFGCDVNEIEKANGGLILPPFIENALLYLLRYGINSVGIFRKSGVKSRIMSLRQKLEAMTGSKSKESTINRPTDYQNNGINGNTINGGNGFSVAGVTTLPRTGLNNGSRDLYSMGLGTESGSSTIKYRLSSSYAPGEEFCVYDVADMVKMWLREIKPRPLITKEVIAAYKEMMSSINNNVENSSNTNGHGNTSSNSPSPIDLSLKLTVLLTDSQRALLEIFLHFLSLFAANCEVNQMSSQNLAICFTPSLCECSALTGTGTNSGGGTNTINNNLNGISNNNNHLNGNHNINNNNGLPFGQDNNNGFHVNGGSSLPRSADTEIIFDAQKCLQYLIENCSAISMIPSSSLPFPPSPSMITLTGNTNNINKKPGKTTTPKKTGSGYQTMDQSMDISSDDVDHLSSLMPSLSLTNGGYLTSTNGANDDRFQTKSPSNSNLINGGHLLPSTYESSITINAAPIDILKRILYQRNLFDPSVVEWRIIKQTPSENSDTYEFKVQSSFFLPLKTFTIQRKWSFIENQSLIDNPTSSSTLYNTSSSTTTSPSSSSRSFYSSLRKPKPNKNTFKGIILRETGYLYDSWWKIGTSGEGKCQLDISIAVDLRGHSFYWYTNTFPAIIDWQLYQIKQSFLVDFIETKNFKSTNV
ncbi:uncharacterized protein DDB_G0288805-like [Panonychus citri]|uniref:uncharacterized protein DDB_G0288805-like n=1 Tax=Panonychus citri TaxID=50023 RepID=UPI00230768CE|nr:uncharacterized protein DDB_G0288805-like [Panonychus citri]